MRFAAGSEAWLTEPEGERIPGGLRVFDAHVHLFPDRMFDAIWRWFDAYAWPIRYRLYAEQVVEFLLARGVSRFTGLLYAHKPGMARDLNRFMAELARAHSQLVPLGTVYPGEPDAEAVVREALALGLRGIKLHCHVQKVAPNDPRLDPVYALCAAARVPVLIHAGREPSFAAYGVDTRKLCGADQVDDVLRRHPALTLIVPHLGADEFGAYAVLLARHPNLWLDTTMAIGGFLEAGEGGADTPGKLFPRHADRLLYGTDFPNIPHAWDRELNVIRASVPAARQAAVLYENAAKLFGA